MRKVMFFIVPAALLIGCASSHNVQRQAEEQRIGLQVADSIDARSFTIHFYYVQPQNMIAAHYLTSDYYVKLKGDSIVSFLPYFGRAYRSDYSNQTTSPLSFSTRVQNLTIKRGKKKDFNIFIKVNHDSEVLDYYVRVFQNGSSTLSISSSDRSSIAFNGQMTVKDDQNRGNAN